MDDVNQKSPGGQDPRAAKPGEDKLLAVERGGLRAREQQLVVVLMDASESMTEDDKVGKAVAGLREFHAEVAAPKNCGMFQLALVEFGERAEILLEPTAAVGLDPASLEIVVERQGKFTDFTKALERAGEVVRKNKNARGKWKRAITMMVTDGWHNRPSDPRAAAKRVKLDADLVCVGIGADADMELLGELATSPKHVDRCANGAELRRFLAAAGATISQVAVTGRDAAALLSASLGKKA